MAKTDKSPIKQLGTGVVDLQVMINGSKVPDHMMVLEAEVVKEVNKIPFARVMIYDGDSREQTFPQSDEAIFEPGNEVEIKVTHDPSVTPNTIFKGIIVDHGIKLRKDGTGCLALTCKDECLKMTVGRRNMIFYDKTDSDIIKEVCKEAGIKASPKVDATTGSHKKMIQYNCTNWEFIQARAEANGLITVIDNGEVSIIKPGVSDKIDLKITYGIDLLDMDIKMGASHQYESVEANYWDYTEQKVVNVKGKKPTTNSQGDSDSAKLSKVLGHKEIINTTAPVTKEQAQALADSVYQRGHLSRIKGRLKFVGSDKVVPGKVLELASVGKRFNGDAFVGKVRHTVRNGQWLTEVGLGLPSSSGGSLSGGGGSGAGSAGGGAGSAGGLSSGTPSIGGIQQGVVKQIKDDPDGQYRVLVTIPVIDNNEGEGVWARMSLPYATEDCGFVIFPEIGDEVILGFLGNDPTYPVMLGSLYSNKQMITSEEKHDPAEPNHYKAMSFNKGKMRLEFKDDPGKNEFKLITEDNMMIHIDDGKDSITIDDPVNKSKMVMDPKGVTLTVDKDLTVDVTGEIKVTGKKNIAVEATQDIKAKALNIKMEGKVNVEIKAGAQLKGEGAIFEIKGSGMGTVDGGGMLTLKGGMVMIN